MRTLPALFVVWLQVMLVVPASAQSPVDPAKFELRPGRQPAPPASPAANAFQFAPTGLTMRRPFVRGKVPVVFIHGLWATPRSWEPMIQALEADRTLSDAYQFWTFGYSTGDPIPYSASLLRQKLEDARRQVDPGKTDPSMNRIVLIGHSMGGLLAKMMVVESGPPLWNEVSDRPFDELLGEPDDRDIFAQTR